MTQDQRDEMRFRQLEDSVRQLQQLVAELKFEIDALGDVIVVTAASLDSVSRGGLLKRLGEAADAQRALDHDRAANALDTLITAAELDAAPAMGMLSKEGQPLV